MSDDESYLRSLLQRLLTSMAFGAWPSAALLQEAAKALPNPAEVDASLSKSLPPNRDHRRIGNRVLVDLAAREVYLDGVPVAMSHLEYELLAYMLANPRRALSREQLLLNVYGHGFHSVDRSDRVYQLAGRVRRKLALDGHLVPVVGYGYRLDP